MTSGTIGKQMAGGAMIGVNSAEPPAAMDGILTLGLRRMIGECWDTNGRLGVIDLKADDDLYLALQGLGDRVRALASG